MLFFLIICGLLSVVLSVAQGKQEAAVVAGVVTLCMIVLEGLGIRAGISADASGVTVVSGLGRSHHVPWSEVSSIKYRHWTGRGRAYIIRVHRTDGKVLTTSGCTYYTWNAKTDPKTQVKVQAVVAALNSARPR
ncbi:MAG TPA: PH domain-containing protein [Streptosporangiaceae bacterium]|nr:PH domain-containing protein [Streptosporangiaceae bacterium]